MAPVVQGVSCRAGIDGMRSCVRPQDAAAREPRAGMVRSPIGATSAAFAVSNGGA
jgi:hypothetical protein